MKRLQWPPIIFVAILVAIFACLAVAGEARRRVDPAPALADTNQLHTAPVGDVRAAIEALRSTATRPGPLQADATRRLAALARVGAVATSDTDLLQAHESLFAAQVNRGDVFDGSLTLDALGELDGKGMSWRLLHARLFAASARMDLTAREYDALLVRVAGQHSIRSIATQIDRVNALLRSRTLEEESVWRMEAERDRQLLWLRTVEAGMTDRDAAPVSSMIIDAARDSILYETPSDRDLQRSYWIDLDRIIGSQQSPGVKQLRVSQNSAVEQDLRLARESGDVPALLVLWRRYPWAHEANVALLDYASRMLREDRPSLAAASFRDVSTHAQDPKLLEQARTGLALCRRDRSTTADDDHGERSAAPSSSPVIVARDLPSNSGDSALRRIALPAACTHHPAVLFARHIADDWTSARWPPVDVQFFDNFVLAASPSILACYREDSTSEPAWQRILRGSWRTGGRDENVILPHPTHPAVDGSRVYARWGRSDVVGDLLYDLMVEGRSMPASRLRRLHTGFAAFDLRTGRALWATADMPEWKDLLPAGDPAVDSHSVYLPVVVGDRFSMDKQTLEFRIACANKTDGEIRWLRTVGWITPVVRGGPHRQAWFPGLEARTTEVDGMIYTVTGNGLVACLDARDGMIAWKREYAGYEPMPSSAAVQVQRVNHEPIPCGGLLVMAVRDRPGAWAVRKDNGQIAWDLPWLPSEAVLPLPGNRLFLQDTRDALVVSAEDGRLAWRRRFTEPIRGSAWIDTPGTLRVQVGHRLLRIDDGSGDTRAESPAAGYGLVSCYAQRDETVFYASADRTAGEEDAIPPDLRVSDADGSAHVRRRVPRLFEPPDTSPLAGTAFLSSDGFIEALDAAGAETRWRRALRPDFMEPLFAGPAVLIASHRRIVAVDGRSGDFAWQATVPETVQSWHVAGSRCIGVGTDRLFAMDLQTGEPAWAVPLPPRSRIALARPAAEGLCLVVETSGNEDPRKRVVTIHVYGAADGAGLRESTIPIEECKAASAKDNRAWIVGSDRHVYHVDLAKGNVTRSGEPVLTDAESTLRGSRRPWSAVLFATDGPYALLDAVLPNLRKRWVFTADGTSFMPAGTRNYLPGDRKLCEASGRRLRIVDLDSGKESAVCTIPISHEVEAVRLRGDRMLVLSLMTPPDKAASPVHDRHYRVDLFDTGGGPIVGRSLPGIRPVSWALRDGKGTWGSELAWTGARVLLTDSYGLHSLVLRQEAYAQREEPQVLVYRTARSITADGSLEEFDEQDRIPPAAARSDAAAQCFVTQDGKDLILAVSYLNTRPDAILERGRLISAGDRLEMELRTNRKPDEQSVIETFRWNVGLSGDGHAVFTPDAPAGIRGVVGYDMDTRLMSFEMAVPIDSITDRTHLRHADLRFSMSVQDDEYGPAPLAVWREAPLRLHPMTRSEETHGLAIAAAFPSLDESQWFLKHVIEAHVTDWPTGRAFAEALLKEYARSPFAAWILRYLDKRIESRTGMRDFEGLRAVAARAGVSSDTLAWYSAFPTPREQDPSRVMPGEDNTLMPESEPMDRNAITTIFRRHIPPLGIGEATTRFFSAYVRMLGGSAETELELVTWFLRTFPGHPQVRNYLNGAWELARRDNEDTALERMDTLLQESGISGSEAYRFRRTATHMGHARLQNWHVVGPFPGTLSEASLSETILPKQQARITLKEQYRLSDRKLRWQRYTAETGVVDMSRVMTNPFVKSLGYAVTWVKPAQAGPTVLEVGSFGPCSVWINGRMVYRSEQDTTDQWLPKGYTIRGLFPVRAVPVWLPQNWSMILVENGSDRRGWQFGLEFIQSEGKGPVIGMESMRPDGPGIVTVTGVPRPALLPGGLRAEYFDDKDLSELRLVRKDPSINFHWVLESPDPRIDWDTFSARWTGRLTPRFTEPYQFIVRVNDGVRMWLDGKLLIDNWTYHGGRPDYATAVLYTNVAHHLRLEYYEATDHANVSLEWESKSQPREIIPPECLSSSWYLVDTIIAPPDPTSPVGVPRFAGMRVTPRDVWIPTGTRYRFTAIPVNQYGETIDAAAHFDAEGNPINTGVQWTVIPGGRINLYDEYGGAAYVPHRLERANGEIDENGLFVSDGSRGLITIRATSLLDPNIQGYASLVVDDLPAIGPFHGQPLRIGSGFQGDIDRVRIYTKALSAKQIIAHSEGKQLLNIGLLGDWTFDEVVDDKFPNLAGEGLDAAVKDPGVRRITDEGDVFVQMNGGSIEVPDDPRLNFYMEATLETWVRPWGGGGILIDRCRWGTVQGFRLAISGNALICQGNYSHGTLECGANLSRDLWNHVVAVYGLNRMRQLWVNGEMIAERPAGPEVQVW